jgi:hypothetical protein
MTPQAVSTSSPARELLRTDSSPQPGVRDDRRTPAGDMLDNRGRREPVSRRSTQPDRDTGTGRSRGAAGFRGFGLLHADLVPALDQYGVRGLRTLLDDHGIVDLELELLTDWWTTGPARQESDCVRHGLLTVAESLGARHIKIALDVTDGPWDHDHWVSEFVPLRQAVAEAFRTAQAQLDRAR